MATILQLTDFALRPARAGAAPESTGQDVGRTTRLPLRSELEVASKQSTAWGASGDLVEVCEHADGRVSILVADVCGNGVEAAQIAWRIRPLVRATLARGESPGRTLSALNGALAWGTLTDRFVAAVAVRLDVRSGLVEVACAGHLGPFLRRAAGGVRALDGATGLPLGILPGEGYEEIVHRLDADDALVLVTDGVTDPLASQADPLGARALARRLARAPRRAKGLCDALIAHGASTRDDATVLVLQMPAVLATPIAA